MSFKKGIFKRNKQEYCAFCEDEIENEAFEKYGEKFCSKKHAKRYGDRKRRLDMEGRKHQERIKTKKSKKKSCCK